MWTLADGEIRQSRNLAEKEMVLALAYEAEEMFGIGNNGRDELLQQGNSHKNP